MWGCIKQRAAEGARQYGAVGRRRGLVVELKVELVAWSGAQMVGRRRGLVVELVVELKVELKAA